MKHLVFVESPNKKNKLQHILDSELNEDTWLIIPTFGHIKNLPSSKYSLAFSSKKYFADFKESDSWKKQKKSISELIKNEDVDFYIASDLDREGEVIAFDIVESLGIEMSRAKRVVFSSMKREIIVEAFKFPVPFNKNFRDAGVARRVIDRDVGYLLSSFMREDFVRRYGEKESALGIGRTSAPSLNLLALKYYNLIMFSPEKFFKIILNFSHNEKIFYAMYDEEFDLSNKQKADDILNDVLYSGRPFTVAGFEEETEVIKPPSPLDNTSMLYAGWYLYRFNEKKTMQLAQSLFEKEYITYHRSDSVELSDESMNDIIRYIYDLIDPALLPKKPNKYKNKNTSQEGHEAIIPTTFSKIYSPEFLQKTSLVSDKEGYIGDMQTLTKEEFSLYTLIWNRAVASQMRGALVDKSLMTIKNGDNYFFATRKNLIEKGWLDFFGEYILNSTEGNSDFLTKFRKNDFDKIDFEKELTLKDASILERETEPPKRYGKGQFIRAIANKGIGRPSTLYTIPDELLNKKYANSDENGIIEIVDNGLLVIEWINEVIPELLEDGFIKEFEENLNKIAEGELDKTEYIIRIHSWLLSIAKKNRYSISIIEESTNLSSLKEQNFKSEFAQGEDKEPIKEKIIDCGFCGNGDIFLKGSEFYCSSCDFSISTKKVATFIQKIGKDVDEIYVERAIIKSLTSDLPVFIPKITSKKGNIYDGNFSFVKNGKYWGLEFYKDKKIIDNDADNELDNLNADNNQNKAHRSSENEKEVREHTIEEKDAYGEDMKSFFSEADFYQHLEYFSQEESETTYIFVLTADSKEELLQEMSEMQNCALYEMGEKIAIIATEFDEEDSENLQFKLESIDKNVKSSDIVKHITIEKQTSNLLELYENGGKNTIRLKEEAII